MYIGLSLEFQQKISIGSHLLISHLHLWLSIEFHQIINNFQFTADVILHADDISSLIHVLLFISLFRRPHRSVSRYLHSVTIKSCAAQNTRTTSHTWYRDENVTISLISLVTPDFTLDYLCFTAVSRRPAVPLKHLFFHIKSIRNLTS